MPPDPVAAARPLEPGEPIDPRAGLLPPLVADEPEPPTPGWLKRGTDAYLAWRFVARHRDDLRYCHAFVKGYPWFLWNGRFWEKDRQQRVVALVIACAKVVADEIYQEIQAIQAAAGDEPSKEDRARLGALRSEQKILQDANKVRKVLLLASADERISVPADAFDRDPHLLACANGTVDLRTGALRPARPTDLITRGTGVPYLQDDKKLDAGALAALERVLGHMATLEGAAAPDARLLRYYQLTLGNSIFGHNRLERFYLAHGASGSGKGTLFEAIKAALGADLAITAESKTFAKEKNYRIRDDLQRLNGGRLVVAAEQDRGEQLAAGVLNNLAGGDTVVSRALYSQLEEHRATFTIWIQVNNLPWIDWTEVGIRRRLRVVPMGQAVAEDARDPALKELLLDPARGGPVILRWLVAGAVATHRARDIEEPLCVRRATGAYWQDQDQAADFIVECLRLARPGDPAYGRTFALVEDLTRAYHKWSDESRIPDRYRLSARRLDERLRELGLVKRRAKIQCGLTGSVNRWWYFGATLLPSLGVENRAEGISALPESTCHEEMCGQYGLIGSKVPEAETEAGTSEDQASQGFSLGFQGSTENQQNPTHARACAHAPENSLPPLEPWNLGTSLIKEEEEEPWNLDPGPDPFAGPA